MLADLTLEEKLKGESMGSRKRKAQHISKCSGLVLCDCCLPVPAYPTFVTVHGREALIYLAWSASI